jgi:hypothetical protein
MASSAEYAPIIAALERIDALLAMARAIAVGAASIASAGVGFDGPSVANQAAATALPLSTYATARFVYTRAQEAIWQYIPGVPGTVGVPALKADEVIAAAGGVLARTTYSSPKWRTDVNDVFIDPANPAASNENDGFTALTPLLTGYELHRRWGWDASRPIVGCNLATSPDGFTHVRVQSDLVSPDSLPIKITIAHDSLLQIESPLLAANILRTAVLTNAVTPMNRAVPLGGTRLRIQDNTLANWTAFMAFNRRVRFLDGPAGPGPGTLTGGTLQPQTNQAGGAVDCSACQTTSPSAFSFTPTAVTPAVGNTYVVEQLVQVNLGEIDIAQELNPTFGGYNAIVYFLNINLPSIGGQSWAPQSNGLGLFAGVELIFFQCTIDRSIDGSAGNVVLNACYGSQGAFSTGGHQQQFIVGGGWNGGIAGSGVQIAINGQGGSFETAIDFDAVFNLAFIVAITGPVRSFASWNAAVTGGLNAGGHGVMIGGGGPSTFFGMRGDAQCKGTIWGNSTTATATGLLVCASCNGIGAPQNITGPTSDFKLGNKILGWFFNDVTTAYAPVGAAGVPTTWAALTAAEGAAGFGGNAHELDSNSHFVAAETTA